MSEQLYIVGAGGHGRETLMLVRDIERAGRKWDFLGFLDLSSGVSELLERIGASVVGKPSLLATEAASYVIAIGNPETRRRIASEITHSSSKAVVLVHPDVIVDEGVLFAPGCVVASGSFIGTSSTLGAHTHVNVAGIVGPRCQIGSFVSLSPGTCVEQDVRIGEGAFLGTRAIVRAGVSIGASARIGAGCVVTHDVPAGTLHVGNPGLNKPSSS